MLGDRIKQKRKELRMTAEALAEKLSVIRNTVYRWESGERVPSDEDKRRLADALNTSVSFLIGETDDFTQNNRDQIQPQDEMKLKSKLAEELDNMVRDLAHDNPEISILMRNTAEHWDELNDIEKQAIADGIAFVLGRTNADIDKRLKKESRHGRF